MARLPHEHLLERHIDELPLCFVPVVDDVADLDDPARVAKDVWIGGVDDHVRLAVAVHVLDVADAGAGRKGVQITAELAAVEADQVEDTAVCAGAALDLQPDPARRDLHLGDAILAQIIRPGDLDVVAHQGQPRQLLPGAVLLREDGDEVIGRRLQIEIAHAVAVDRPQRTLPRRHIERQRRHALEGAWRQPGRNRRDQTVGRERRPPMPVQAWQWEKSAPWRRLGAGPARSEARRRPQRGERSRLRTESKPTGQRSSWKPSFVNVSEISNSGNLAGFPLSIAL